MDQAHETQIQIFSKKQDRTYTDAKSSEEHYLVASMKTRHLRLYIIYYLQNTIQWKPLVLQL